MRFCLKQERLTLLNPLVNPAQQLLMPQEKHNTWETAIRLEKGRLGETAHYFAAP